MEADDSPQIKGAVTISLPPPDNPSMCKTIPAFSVTNTDTDFLLQQNQTHHPIIDPNTGEPEGPSMDDRGFILSLEARSDAADRRLQDLDQRLHQGLADVNQKVDDGFIVMNQRMESMGHTMREVQRMLQDRLQPHRPLNPVNPHQYHIPDPDPDPRVVLEPPLNPHQNPDPPPNQFQNNPRPTTLEFPRSPPPLQLPQSRFPLSRFFLGTPGKTLGFLCISVLALVIFMSLFHSNILQELKNPNHDKDDDHHGPMSFIFPLHLREIPQSNDFVPDRCMAWVPMLGIPSKHFYHFRHFYQAQAMRLVYGASPLSRLGGRIVFDSGSSYTYFTREAYSELVSSLKKVYGAGLTQDTSDSMPLCWQAEFPIRSVADVRKFFKTITLQFGSQWFLFSTNFRIPPEGYLIISKKGNVCLGILDGSNVYDGSTIILGDISLRGRLVVYDNVKKKIGWMASDCIFKLNDIC